jgi:hypothetical protein
MEATATNERQNLFVFRFRFLPTHLCRNLYFWEVGVAEAQFLCTRDLLSVSFAAAKGDAVPLLTRAKTLATALVDAHAYLSFPDKPALDVISEGWVEVTGGEGLRLIVGYADSSLSVDPLNHLHEDNVGFASASPQLVRMLEVPGLAAALADFRAARLAPAAYSAIFAFRALEDVAMGISQVVDSDDRRQMWALMNERVGTGEDDWLPLTQASKASRHGNPFASDIPDDDRLLELLRIAKRALDLWIGPIQLVS